MDYLFSYCTDKGPCRDVNQDSLCFKSAEYKGNTFLLAAVCDGMGGLSDGENASAYVIKKLSQWFENNLASLLHRKKRILDIRKNLDEYIHMVNDKINKYSAKNNKMLGTTMTAIIVLTDINKILTAHVGDSRAYKISDNEITLITNDHSVVGEEVRNGFLTEELANSDERQNQLTKCIGADFYDISYDYTINDMESCVYMLCSDGFRKKISSSEFSESLKPSEITDKIKAENTLRRLTELNIQRDETDNITSLLLRII